MPKTPAQKLKASAVAKSAVANAPTEKKKGGEKGKERRWKKKEALSRKKKRATTRSRKNAELILHYGYGVRWS